MESNPTPQIAFFGSSTHSADVVRYLIQNKTDIRLCFTQQPKPVGRHKQLTPTLVDRIAREHEIPVFYPEQAADNSMMMINTQSIIKLIHQYNANIILVVAYGQILPDELLASLEFGGINLHPSLLPAYRGATPVQWAILSGEKETGITIMKLAREIDAGEILTQDRIPIHTQDTASKLYEKLFKLGAEKLHAILPEYLNHKIQGKKQGPATTPYARRLNRDDGYIPFNVLTENATSTVSTALYEEIGKRPPWPEMMDRMMRAFHPWPGVWTLYANEENKLKRLKILSHQFKNNRFSPTLVQPEGKTPLPWETFLQTHPLPAVKP